MGSRSADACPNCGRRLKKRWYEIGPFTTAVVLGPPILILAVMFLVCARKGNPNDRYAPESRRSPDKLLNVRL